MQIKKLFPALSALTCLVPLAAWAGPVDINTADAATLSKELDGVGPSRAQAIVAYRTQHGPFKSADDLSLVKNIPQKIVEKNRDKIRVGGAPPAQGPAKTGAKTGDNPSGKPAAKTAPAQQP